MTSAYPRRRFGQDSLRLHSILRSAGTVLALACFVFLMEETMHRVGFFNNGQAIWWPTNGLALALMLRTDRRQWLAILAGALLGSLAGELHYGYPWSTNIVNAIANSAGPLLGAIALPRFRKLEDWMQERHLVSRFVGFVLLLAPAVSTTINASYRYLFVPGSDFWKIMEGRGVSDMLGYAMLTPLVLVLSNREMYKHFALLGIPSTVLLLSLVSITTFIVFGQSSFPLIFVLLSVTLMVSMRIGFAPSVIAVNLLAVIATSATMRGHGPLTLGGGSILEYRILLLQAFLALTMVTIFSIGVIQIESKAFQSKLKLAYEEMEKLATIDVLTGVGNRRLFEDFLETEWERALRSSESIAVLMIDIDNFKLYNDDFGHPAGDACLRAVAHAVLKAAHRSTDLLTRYGGEEFIFLLPGTTVEGAAHIAETIRLCVEDLYMQPDSNLRRKVTVTIGCAATVPGPDLLPGVLIGASDEALYRAKQNGRNRVELAITVGTVRAIRRPE